ncbi:MAG TPA: chloramphenicol acetyltransferase [Nannocystis exedens]|nr:chloramphenicol acetyltransferase [Nannocystis exedens]
MPTPIDLDTWPRRAAYEFFKGFDDPFFNICSEVEVGPMRAYCEATGSSFFLACLYAGLRAVHSVDALRLRIRGDQVVLCDRVRGGSTVLNADESFGFVYVEYHPEIAVFIENAEAVLRAHRSAGPSFRPGVGDEVIYFSVIPWIRFSSVSHARNHRTTESVPKIVFGRFAEHGGGCSLPVSIEVHHALVDGLHVGRFFEALQGAFCV